MYLRLPVVGEMGAVVAVAVVARPVVEAVAALPVWDSTAAVAEQMVAQAAVAQVPLESMVPGPVLVQAVPVKHGLTGQRGQAAAVVVETVADRVVRAVAVTVWVVAVALLAREPQIPEAVGAGRKEMAGQPGFRMQAVPAS